MARDKILWLRYMVLMDKNSTPFKAHALHHLTVGSVYLMWLWEVHADS